MKMKKAKLHVLKIERRFFDKILLGDKPWELRLNDRDYQEGDLIHFVDIDGCELACVPRWQDGLLFNLFIILYVFEDHKYGLKEGYCILTLKRVERK